MELIPADITLVHSDILAFIWVEINYWFNVFYVTNCANIDHLQLSLIKLEIFPYIFFTSNKKVVTLFLLYNISILYIYLIITLTYIVWMSFRLYEIFFKIRQLAFIDSNFNQFFFSFQHIRKYIYLTRIHSNYMNRNIISPLLEF